jgi:gluconate kinase
MGEYLTHNGWSGDLCHCLSSFEKEKSPAVVWCFSLRRTVTQHVRKQAPTMKVGYIYNALNVKNIDSRL